jgi:predicted nucleotidyltransferase
MSPSELHDALAALCTRTGVSILYVFGSRALEIAGRLAGGPNVNSSPGSDVDIGARPRPGLVWSVADKVRLAQALEELFGCSRVDLVVLSEADPFLAVEIVRGERLYAEDSYEADEYDLYVLRRAGDLAPLERERQALIFGEPL